MGKREKKLWWEECHPLLIALIITVLLVVFARWCDIYFSCNIKNYEKILDASITFSSIVVGFVGVLLGILISIKETKIVQTLFTKIRKQLLVRYFKESIFSGIAVIVTSSSLYLIQNEIWSKLIFYIWIFTLIYFMLSSYRIIDILFMIIFQDNSLQDMIKGNRMSDKEAKELEDRFRSK